MIDELRSSFARQAELVVAVPDPYARLQHRRHRHQRNVTAGLAVLAVLLVVPASLVTIRGLRGGPAPAPALSPLVQALLDSPTRGSLAGDRVFLATIRQMSARPSSAAPATSYTPGGSSQPGGADGATASPWLPLSDPARLRVLFAGDVPDGKRVALVAAPGSTVVLVWWGATGDPASAMGFGADLPLDPVLRTEFSDENDGHGVRLVLAPSGSRLDLSDGARYLADGAVARSWRSVPADYLAGAFTELPIRARVRVSYDGARLYEGQFDGAPDTRPLGPIDTTPVHGRGTPEPVPAQRAAEYIAQTTGLTTTEAHYQVLWSGEVPLAGPEVGMTALVATVFAQTADGGGPCFTAMLDSGKSTVSYIYLSRDPGVLGDPERSVTAVRLPVPTSTSGEPPLLLIAPATAVRAEVLRNGSVLVDTALVQGTGRVTLAVQDGAVTLRAYDASGAVVAEHSFDDYLYRPGDGYEPDYLGW